MHDLIDLSRYPLDRPESAEFAALVARCRDELACKGLFNLHGFVKPAAMAEAVAQLRPTIDTAAYTHARTHNIYFKPTIEGLSADHPALRKVQTVSHTVCADQMAGSLILRLYEWPPFIDFVARVMDKPHLFAMADPLARVNVMSYRAGEALNWHFDRSEFTTTLLLQAPEAGGELEYAKDLRSETDPNYAGVARLLEGELETVIMPLAAGTLNIFRGRNTAHRVRPVRGARERVIAVFSYFDRPGVMFSAEERQGFYGRAEPVGA